MRVPVEGLTSGRSNGRIRIFFFSFSVSSVCSVLRIPIRAKILGRLHISPREYKTYKYAIVSFILSFPLPGLRSRRTHLSPLPSKLQLSWRGGSQLFSLDNCHPYGFHEHSAVIIIKSVRYRILFFYHVRRILFGIFCIVSRDALRVKWL